MSRMGTTVVHMETNPPAVLRQITAEIRGAMQAAGVSQRELSARTGLPLVTLSRRLVGSGKPWDLNELLAVAAALDLSLAELVIRAERAALTAPAA